MIIWIIALIIIIAVMGASIVMFSAEVNEELEDEHFGEVLREEDIKEEEE